MQVEPAVRVHERDQRRVEDWRTSTKRMDPLPAAESLSSESGVMLLVPVSMTEK